MGEQIGSKVMIDKFHFHYVPVAGEMVTDTAQPENVLAPIKRPLLPPSVTAVPDIRSRFSFDFADDDKIRTRPLSCHCDACIRWEFANCEGGKFKWVATTMYKESASKNGKAMRSRKDKLSRLRRLAARGTTPGEIVALESRNDSEGFGFWLAEVVESAAYCMNPKTQWKGLDHAVQLVKGHYYIKVKMLARFPVDSPGEFRLLSDEEDWIVPAEGVMLRNVVLEEQTGVRARRKKSNKKASKRQVGPRMFELSPEQLQRCTEAAEEKLDAEGTSKHKEPDQVEPMPQRHSAI